MNGLHVPARRHPDGWIAQRLGRNPDQPWVLMTVVDHHLHIELLADDQVTDWPELVDP